MSAFEKAAIQHLIDQATQLGVPIPAEVHAALVVAGQHGSGVGARTWVELHPDQDTWPPEARGCCIGSAVYGAGRCTCWTPVFELEQADPQPPECPDDLTAQPRMCGDCAFRKGSPERAVTYSEEMLFALAASKTPFWCHQEMRRPARWVHPQLGSVPGSDDDWQPPTVDGIPYRADGRPGLLCAGWIARAARAETAPKRMAAAILATQRPADDAAVDAEADR